MLAAEPPSRPAAGGAPELGALARCARSRAVPARASSSAWPASGFPAQHYVGPRSNLIRHYTDDVRVGARVMLPTTAPSLPRPSTDLPRP